MRKLALGLIGVTALAAGTVAVSQTAPRPTTTISPQNVQIADPGAPSMAPLIAKIDKLSADLAAANKKIDGLEAAQKTISTKGFENAGKISALDKEFQAHSHYQIYMQDVQEGGTEKTKIYTSLVSIPHKNCKPKPGAPPTGSINTRFDCSASNAN